MGGGPGHGLRGPGRGDLVFAGLDLGGVFVAVQPPRGFGEQPAAIYHSPDLPPTHHYLGFYRWLDEVWGADAIVHAGKHGTLEWLPGKGVGLSAGCYPGRGARRPCRSSTPSSSTTPARAPRPSAGPTPSSSTTCCRR